MQISHSTIDFDKSDDSLSLSRSSKSIFFGIWLIFLGVLGFTSHLLIIFAIQLSNLSFVTNFQYSQLIWSTLINFYIFGVPFDFNKTFGVIGIIVFGVFFVQAESRKKKISS